MRRTVIRVVLAAVCAFAGWACGRDSPTAPTPTTTTPPPVAAPPPAPAPPPTTAVNITGNWAGIVRFQGDFTGDGVRQPAAFNIVAEIQHDTTGRVTGTWRSVVGGGTVGGPFGSLEGTITGVGTDARFRGRWVQNVPSTDPSLRCEASVIVNGSAAPPSMRWDAETTMTFDRCLGSAAELQITLNR